MRILCTVLMAGRSADEIVIYRIIKEEYAILVKCIYKEEHVQAPCTHRVLAYITRIKISGHY